jgi:hypothetical protein
MKISKNQHALAAAGFSALLSCASTAQAQREFRVLFIVKPSINVPGQVNYTMSEQEIDVRRTAFMQTYPAMVLSQTASKVSIRPTYMVTPRTVTTTWKTRVDPNAPNWVLGDDLPAGDRTDYFGTFARGWYDQVQCISGAAEGNANEGGFSTNSQVSFSYLSRQGDGDFVTNGDGLGAAWHEMLHGWQLYYDQVRGFNSGGANPDNATTFGYNVNSGGLPNWIAFLRDMTVRNINGGTVGWGTSAFSAHATPRSRFADTAPGIVNNAFYRIEGRQSSRPLNVSGGGTADGTPLVQWVYSTGGSFNEQFKLVATTSGYYTMRPRSSAASAIEVANNNSGTPVVQWTLNGGNNQQWRPTYRGSGHYSLANRSSNRRLNVNGGSLSAGGTIIQFTLNSAAGAVADNEQFRLIKI